MDRNTLGFLLHWPLHLRVCVNIFPWSCQRPSVHPEPVNVTLFGKRVFAGVAELSVSIWERPGLAGWALNPVTSVEKRREEKRRWREMQRARALKTEAWIWVPCLHTKELGESGRLWEARREAWKQLSLGASRRNQHLDLRFLASRTVRKYLSVFQASPFLVRLWQPQWESNTWPLQTPLCPSSWASVQHQGHRRAIILDAVFGSVRGSPSQSSEARRRVFILLGSALQGPLGWPCPWQRSWLLSRVSTVLSGHAFWSSLPLGVPLAQDW